MTEDSGIAAPFSLSRWFATVGFVSILLLAVIAALLLSRLFAASMLQREGQLTMQFVQGVIDVEEASSYFQSSLPDGASYMEDLLAHLSGWPDVLRTNLYSRERAIIWSSDRSLTGRSFANATNEELDAALSGSLEIHQEEGDELGRDKPEHANLRSGDDYFIELYIPVWDKARLNVVGAIELYRAPQQLRDAIRAGVRLIWAAAIGAGMLLYLALLPLVRRAQWMIRTQQDRIVAAETLAAVGDLGSAVAHGMRNPLAVIRSSAEIVKEGGSPEVVREAAADIMGQVDRLEHWLRELLTYVHLPTGESHPVDLESLARGCLAHFSVEMRRRGIEGHAGFETGLPAVGGDPILLGQVLNSLIANAIEAMSRGGKLRLDGARGASGAVLLRIKDTGTGMTGEQINRAFKPFHTTKSQGLGVGLPLARRIVERMGGSIALSSEPGSGATVELVLPAAHR
ncbi:MAG: ATP-binding protein [Steroidobacteraceae bacterium]